MPNLDLYVLSFQFTSADLLTSVSRIVALSSYSFETLLSLPKRVPSFFTSFRRPKFLNSSFTSIISLSTLASTVNSFIILLPLLLIFLLYFLRILSSDRISRMFISLIIIGLGSKIICRGKVFPQICKGRFICVKPFFSTLASACCPLSITAALLSAFFTFEQIFFPVFISKYELCNCLDNSALCLANEFDNFSVVGLLFTILSSIIFIDSSALSIKICMFCCFRFAISRSTPTVLNVKSLKQLHLLY